MFTIKGYQELYIMLPLLSEAGPGGEITRGSEHVEIF